jgi:hypothetical protein
MIVGSVILCWVALGNVGGFSGMHDNLEAQSATLVNFLPTDISLGISLYFVAFFLGGLGVAGQPQVVSRVMTLKSDKDRKQAMIWFFVWQTPFIALMFIVGLASRVLFTDGDFDAELGLPALAMDTLPALGVGMILASIFAATMSTADSQVLACTAAITDDIKPEWREDHKTTKKVTLYVAAAATLISIAGLYIPGGDSVFTLVVLAVYGLGGIFVPLLIIRWMGYKPDSFHSIVMMISAFTGVIVWTLLGLGEDVFPSVPGVGAAFTAHIVMCLMRDNSESNPFGRFEITQDRKKQFITYGIVALCFAGVAEGAYAVYGPDSDDSTNANRVAMYQIDGDLTFLEIGSGTEVISDSAEVTASSDAIDFSGLNIVGFKITTSHVDNEQPCNFLANTEEDQVGYEGGIGDLMVANSGTQQNLESVEYWVDSSLIGTTTNNSVSSIEMMLDGGDFGIGNYDFTIDVVVNSGGAGCQNGDADESVDWTISLIALEYTLTEIKS